jgi:hypothetical protein
MDNASNNNTLMEFLEQVLTEKNIPFDRDGNRVRYIIYDLDLPFNSLTKILKVLSSRCQHCLSGNHC